MINCRSVKEEQCQLFIPAKLEAQLPADKTYIETCTNAKNGTADKYRPDNQIEGTARTMIKIKFGERDLPCLPKYVPIE